jgi:hypothetical protein
MKALLMIPFLFFAFVITVVIQVLRFVVGLCLLPIVLLVGLLVRRKPRSWHGGLM